MVRFVRRFYRPELGNPFGWTMADEARDVAALGSRFTFVDARAAVTCPGTSDCGLRRPPNYVHLTPEGYRRYAALLRDKLPAR